MAWLLLSIEIRYWTTGITMAKKKPDEDLDLGIEQVKGSKKKLIIIITLGLLSLVGGGLGLGWFLFGGEETETVKDLRDVLGN